MKNVIVSICLTILFAAIGYTAVDDIEEHRNCAQCGMDRKAYGYARMLIVYADGESVGVCSLHCCVVELDKQKGREVKTLLAADRNTRTLIDAEKAFWVMGGGKRGVMTKRPKWAFAEEKSARSFIDSNGGAVVSWTEVLDATREELRRQAGGGI